MTLLMPVQELAERRWLSRLGGGAAMLGSGLGLVGNLMHPGTPGPGDPDGTARVVAESAIWVPLHLVLSISFLLMLFGLIALAQSLGGGLAGALARLGVAAGIVGTAVGLLILTTDGFASKHLAEAWFVASPDLQAGALGSFRTEEAISFALLSPLNLVFGGLTFVLFGLAGATSRAYPRWLGWTVTVGGLGCAGSGISQASMGQTTPFSDFIGLAAPSIITAWLFVMGLLLFRRSLPASSRRTPPAASLASSPRTPQ